MRNEECVKQKEEAMKKRKVLATILTAAMVLSSFSMAFAAEESESQTVAESAQKFTDTQGHWASAAIEKWADYNVLKGSEGNFRPDAPITRAEMATVLDNMMDYQAAAKNNFSDVPANAWYAEAVLKANAAGILNGDGLGHATPTANVTKEQAVLMLGRAFAVAEGSKAGTKFNDTNMISSWAESLVYGMEAAGYISGYEGKFNPKSNITKAEVVTIINNAVKAYYTEAGTYTDNVDGLAIIKVSDVVIKDATIGGNVIIAEGVGDGNVTFDGNAEVKGDLVVRGGGENSIVIKGKANIKNVVVARVGGKVRIFADGVTIGEVEANEEVILEGSFTNVTVTADAEVVVKGTITKLDMTKGSTADIQSGTVSTMNLPAGAKANIATSATVKTANVTGAAEIKGTGKIETANISGEGAKIAQKPAKTNLSSDAKANVDGKDVGKESDGGSGGGSGGGNSGGDDPVTHPTLGLNSLVADGVTKADDNEYQIPVGLIQGTSNSSISVNIKGSDFVLTHVYQITVEVERTSEPTSSKTAKVSNIPGALVNKTYTKEFSSLTELLSYYESLGTITGDDSSQLTPFLATQKAGSKFKVTFTYKDITSNQSGTLNNGVFKFKLVP